MPNQRTINTIPTVCRMNFLFRCFCGGLTHTVVCCMRIPRIGLFLIIFPNDKRRSWRAPVSCLLRPSYNIRRLCARRLRFCFWRSGALSDPSGSCSIRMRVCLEIVLISSDVYSEENYEIRGEHGAEAKMKAHFHALCALHRSRSRRQ